MKNFKLINRIVGWLSFLIAAVVYIMTIEPSTSFWDCGEFITSAFKLEVGHPPGAPFFMILGRVFSLFASDVTQVAKMINIMSALASAFTILFLYWTIVHIAKKFILNEEEPKIHQIIALTGSGFVGALAYTFSDTFWFSAVEGEVYATSSLFTAIVFWAMLKWENEADKPYANRWIILIAYLVGLSIGVHLLNLLAIPAMVLIYYFKKYEINMKGIFTASAIAVALLGSIMYGIIPGVVLLASKFELLFVNGFGLPFKSGVLFYIVLLSVVLVGGLYITYQRKKVILNTVILAITVILIGYSSFAMIIIRSLADPPMDQNNPDNVFSLLSYLNREQYGNRPLFRGETFNAQLIDYSDGKPNYVQKDGEYIIKDRSIEYVFDKEHQMLFPRMYSRQPHHIKGYYEWANMEGSPENPTTKRPSMKQNLQFLFNYQIGFMYMRYFMWNFAGRQNDIQGNGNIIHGNWISGIPFVDNARLGNQKLLPEDLKNNKANNKYYFLPLILGLLGLIYLYTKNIKDFWVVMLLFILTGIAIVVYLNQTPYQPRERDYAYAGSFYAFAIWIGLGVLAVYEGINKLASKNISAILATLISLFAVPVVMGAENWDDHDRSGRYTAVDFAHNYLQSCKKNAILFTNGDNDTFPLWYAQEVEGIRTDVRVVNLSYLNTEWYTNQMKRKAYKSEPVPFSLNKDYVHIKNQINKRVSLKEIIKFVNSDDPRTKNIQSGYDFIPSRKIRIPVDKEKVLKNGIVEPEDADKILPYIDIDLKENSLERSKLLILDLINSVNWERPIYFAITVGQSNYRSLINYFQQDGMAYKFVPIKTEQEQGQTGYINTKIMYEMLMNKFKWGGIDKPNVYLDENNTRMAMNIRNNFMKLGEKLVEENKNDSAIKVLDYCQKLLPDTKVKYNFYNLLMSPIYYKAGATDKANEIITKIVERCASDLKFYLQLSPEKASRVDDEDRRSAMIFQEAIRIAEENGQKEFAEKLKSKLKEILH